MADHISPVQYVMGSARVGLWIIGLIWMAHSVMRPDPSERLRWYDRMIRAIGVLILGTLLLFGIPHWFGWIR